MVLIALYDRLCQFLLKLKLVTSLQHFLCSLQPSDGTGWTRQALWNALQDLGGKNSERSITLEFEGYNDLGTGTS